MPRGKKSPVKRKTRKTSPRRKVSPRRVKRKTSPRRVKRKTSPRRVKRKTSPKRGTKMRMNGFLDRIRDYYGRQTGETPNLTAREMEGAERAGGLRGGREFGTNRELMTRLDADREAVRQAQKKGKARSKKFEFLGISEGIPDTVYVRESNRKLDKLYRDLSIGVGFKTVTKETIEMYRQNIRNNTGWMEYSSKLQEAWDMAIRFSYAFLLFYGEKLMDLIKRNGNKYKLTSKDVLYSIGCKEEYFNLVLYYLQNNPSVPKKYGTTPEGTEWQNWDWEELYRMYITEPSRYDDRVQYYTTGSRYLKEILEI